MSTLSSRRWPTGFRPVNLRDLARQAQPDDAATRIRPRGLVFALAPANVDVLFIYAWLLSLLTGNATVVRVSQRPSAVRRRFIDLVRELASQESHRDALGDSWIVTYGHDASVTGRISEVCDARLIWGGDATVSEVRAIPLNSLAVEVAFADRFSLAAFDAAAVAAESEQGVAELARRFVNDTLWFAQQACSSPRAVFWIGDEADVARARERFWDHYRDAARIFEDEPAAVMSRVTDLFVLAGARAIDRLGGPISQLPGSGLGSRLVPAVRDIHSGYGLFAEYPLSHVNEIALHLDEKDQTLVAYGISDADLGSLIDHVRNRAIDRIVAPGEAMDFATVWDGTDLFEVLLRKVTLSRRRSTS